MNMLDTAEGERLDKLAELYGVHRIIESDRALRTRILNKIRTVGTVRSMEDLGEELCNHCEIEESHRGVHNYGGGPVMCIDSGCCERAYENYLEECEENGETEE